MLLRSVAARAPALRSSVIAITRLSRASSSGTYTPPPSETRIRELHAEVAALHRVGSYEDAKARADECYALTLASFGAEHPASASAACNLALMHKHCGEVDDSAVLALSHALHTFAQGVLQVGGAGGCEIITKADVRRGLSSVGRPPASATQSSESPQPLRDALCSPVAEERTSS